jgi:hypothetical protein
MTYVEQIKHIVMPSIEVLKQRMSTTIQEFCFV